VGGRDKAEKPRRQRRGFAKALANEKKGLQKSGLQYDTEKIIRVRSNFTLTVLLLQSRTRAVIRPH
jgi:hypothetical protein